MENIFEPIYEVDEENAIEMFYEDLVEKFKNYKGALSISVCCPLAESDEDDESPTELVCVTYENGQTTFEIVSKRYFYPPVNFSPDTFLEMKFLL